VRIVVSPLHQVDEVLEAWRPSHVIGLTSPGGEVADIPSSVRQLQLRFHDIVGPRDDLRPVSEGDIERLLAFTDAWPRMEPLLIHCWAGVSRSPAVAYAIACMILGAGQEARLAGLLRARAPFATPNPRVIALADAALDRGGAMITAIEAIGRGAETSMGTCFAIDLT
jgi:predicted protein tyrosine phosphatase